jgi:hypothetical protein
MLIHVNIGEICVNFMLIYVNITDRQTDRKSIVRNLTISL